MPIRQSTITAVTGVCLAGLSALLWVGVVNLHDGMERETLVEDRVDDLHGIVREMRNHAGDLRKETEHFAATLDPAALAEWVSVAADFQAQCDAFPDELTRLHATTTEKALIHAAATAIAKRLAAEAEALQILAGAAGMTADSLPPALAPEDEPTPQLPPSEHRIESARQAIFSASHGQISADIRAAFYAFEHAVNRRMRGEIAAARSRTRSWTVLVAATSGLLPLSMVAVLGLLHRQLATPLNRYAAALRNSDSPATRVSLTPSGTVELRRLAEAFNEQSNLNDRRLQELRQTESALRDSLERFDLMAQGANTGLWDLRIDADNPFKAEHPAYWSPRFKQLLGFEEDEFENNVGAWLSRVHPDDVQLVLNANRRHLANREPYRIEYRMYTRQVELRWFEASGQAVWDEAGRPMRMAGSLHDITDRKHAEDALRDSLERFDLMAQGSNTGLWDVQITSDNPFDPVNRMYVSPRMREILGFDSAGDLTIAGWLARVHREDLPGVMNAIEAHLRHARPYSVEYRVWVRGGELRWVTASGQAVWEHDGRPMRMAGSLQDITDRKRLEREREETHKRLQTASRHAGMAEVATGVLHNVGNALNSVNVAASLATEKLSQSHAPALGKLADLLRGHADDLAIFLTADEKGKQVPAYIARLAETLEAEHRQVLHELAEMTQSIDHIKQIVNVQQTYSQMFGIKELIDPRDLVEDALRINAAGLDRHGVRLERRYEEIPPVLLDKHRVLQVLVNLISNAKYALDEAGGPARSLTVQLGVHGPDKNRLRFEVIDNGMGISGENLTRVFSLGFTTRKGGHGYGLHSAALAAKEMGGSLNVRSDGAGAGAAFTLELPLELQEATT